jgi:lipopolysaccharide/colanic/teichoic acid biosynthesis glycosyltransferase
MQSLSCKKKYNIRTILYNIFTTDDVQRSSLQLSPISIEPAIERERSMIQSSTITSSEDIESFDENKKKQLSSTIQKMIKTKYGLCSIIFVIILCLILLYFFLIRLPIINHSSSSLIIKQGKNIFNQNKFKIVTFLRDVLYHERRITVRKYKYYSK